MSYPIAHAGQFRRLARDRFSRGLGNGSAGTRPLFLGSHREAARPPGVSLSPLAVGPEKTPLPFPPPGPIVDGA